MIDFEKGSQYNFRLVLTERMRSAFAYEAERTAQALTDAIWKALREAMHRIEAERYGPVDASWEAQQNRREMQEG